jgi:signal transduction histidine kinase
MVYALHPHPGLMESIGVRVVERLQTFPEQKMIMDPANGKILKKANPTPRRLIIAVVCILCLCLLGSAIYTFTTLSRLRSLYLSIHGHAIAEAIESQARGPGKRNNPAFWQSLFEMSYATYSESVAYLALVDQNGNLLAGKGATSPGPVEPAAMRDSDIYHFEQVLARPRNPRGETNPAVAGWHIRIGLYSSNADFIKRLAYSQLAVSGLAIVALITFSIYLSLMLNRFLEMKAREGAESQLKSLGIMAASLAHEIRNPLGAMKGLTQLAQEDLPPDNAVQSRLHTVVIEAERLERLVADLLDFARPKEPQISDFDLMNLISDVRAMLQTRLDASNVRLHISGDSSPWNMHTDPNGLRQVLLNVILNAVDASPPDSVVRLEIIRCEGGGSILIQVDDCGPGLGGRDPDELFQPFVTTKSRGTGLGLAVSRQIIQSLGGSLTLSDNEQGSARCSLKLPLDAEKIIDHKLD